MSKEYIERGALIATLRGSALAKYPQSFAMGLIAAADEAVKQPAADVAEVKHGEWGVGYYNDADDFVWDCSACGQPNDFLTNYCPNCGAKMDGGADNAQTE